MRVYAEENAPEQNVETNHYQYEMGKGATAEHEGTVYRLGNRKLLGNTVSKYAYEREKAYSAEGKTAVFLADEKRILAIFAVADTLKDTSAEAVKSLKERKIHTAMLTATMKTSPRRSRIKWESTNILPRLCLRIRPRR